MSGLLGQILGGVVAGNLGRRGGFGMGAGPGGGMGGGMGMGRGGLGGSPMLNGLLVALAVHAARQHMSRQGQSRSFDPGQASSPGGAGGGLGGLGGLLGGLGGAGALGGLLGQLRQKGYGQQVDSWVRPGPNQTLAPNQLADALGDDTVQALSAETGLPRENLLSELSQALPEAVDQMTPDGREPSDDDLHRMVGRA